MQIGAQNAEKRRQSKKGTAKKTKAVSEEEKVNVVATPPTPSSGTPPATRSLLRQMTDPVQPTGRSEE